MRHGAVASITIDNPPVNALGQRVRQGLLDAFDWAEAQADVEAVVLYGAGQNFIAGADIREFHKPPETPLLPAVCNRIERSSLLVIAAIHGVCLGGGLEVALSSHYRIAHPDAVFGFPEVTLGLISGAGGTQRLPRLSDAAAALDMISTGKRVSAHEAKTSDFLTGLRSALQMNLGLTTPWKVLDLQWAPLRLQTWQA